MVFSIVTLLCLLICFLYGVKCQGTPCPDSTFVQGKYACYKLFNQPSGLWQATSECGQYDGGNMFFSKSNTFQDLMDSNALTLGETAWYGVVYYVSDNSFSYTDDQTTYDNTSYMPWADGQPSMSISAVTMAPSDDGSSDDPISETDMLCVEISTTADQYKDPYMLTMVSCNTVLQPLCMAPIGSYTTTPLDPDLQNQVYDDADDQNPSSTPISTTKTFKQTAAAQTNENGNSGSGTTQESDSGSKNTGCEFPKVYWSLVVMAFVAAVLKR